MRRQEALYVHLGGPDEVLIVPGPPGGAYLVTASHAVSQWRREPPEVALRLDGIGAKAAEIGGFAANQTVLVEITDARGRRPLASRASREGVVSVAAGDASSVSVSVRTA